ncbi:bifunctional Cytochrome c oxidase assembly protein CtaG-Cox11 [Babesia duncani]|uniref:Bifunctional Cytochrome c oxidase assembly protein CtaG-Cox11 n=1 Tax=Babesia duncani TaxID=323732 RepID=A0AAD9PLS4_9APIC|nr:bifunctional Cytochrome c oxidase assembly protein CtaG-Cox11 [Babesia duncani]
MCFYSRARHKFARLYSASSSCLYLYNVKRFFKYGRDEFYNVKFKRLPSHPERLRRFWTPDQSSSDASNQRVAYTLVAIAIAMFGCTFACIPLYEYFCQSSGYFGKTKRSSTFAPPPKQRSERLFEIDFITHTQVDWEFKPAQKRAIVAPSETTLAFYTAKNLLQEPVIGIAAYNVIPDEAGRYFYKIQCFCFEEQLLGPGEQVDLPVLFFIHPDILKDPKLAGIDKITLTYTFFKSGSEIPPEYTLWLQGDDR